MFEVGFTEMLLIGLVALVVIGPERLPKIARTAGLWVGKARRSFNDVKAEIEQEVKADELRRIVEEQKNSIASHSFIEDTQQAFDDIKTQTEAVVNTATGNSAKNSTDNASEDGTVKRDPSLNS